MYLPEFETFYDGLGRPEFVKNIDIIMLSYDYGRNGITGWGWYKIDIFFKLSELKAIIFAEPDAVKRGRIMEVIYERMRTLGAKNPAWQVPELIVWEYEEVLENVFEYKFG